ncbi:MAG: iron ABC transporter ATP-binding protein [Alphaproteobacteria bacterium]|nr:MAG: iron ABC transporter ATP-binding protein [Alphaproteobacteria bacterium]
MDRKTPPGERYSHGASRPGVERDADWDPDWGRRNTAGVAIASSVLFDRVWHDYGNGPVVSDVTIAVEPGEVLCLLGPSGSGKTTLLRIAAGIDAPTAGSVWVDRRQVAGDGVFVPPEKRGVGLVFQDYALFPHLTILQNVRFGLAGMGRLADEQARRMLARVGMEAFASAYPHQLSGGEQQRVALARALAPRPGILLMDEPFSGLDARLRDSVREGTMGLLRETRATTIIVTHDPEEALRVGDRIALMREGRLVQLGTGEELFYRPSDLFTAGFFTELNICHGRVTGGAVDTPLGRFPAGGLAEGMAVAVCVRLSDVHVAAFGKGTGIAGWVRSRRFMGIAEMLELSVEGHDEPVRARIKAGTLGPDVRDVAVRVDAHAPMVFPRA